VLLSFCGASSIVVYVHLVNGMNVCAVINFK
jgi:hypothetical protein